MARDFSKQNADKAVEEATAVAMTSRNPAFRARMLEMIAKMQTALGRVEAKDRDKE